MQGQGGDWIKWVRNPPAASHMGGVWERQIRSAHSVLLSLCKTYEKSLDEESFLTVVTETEGILNSRPFTIETISDPTIDVPLSAPNIDHEVQGCYVTTREFQQTRFILP